MGTSKTRDADVLVAGAGPTGLVLALWLTQYGVRVRIVDKAPEPGTTSRAIAVQARTLELYRQLGIADAVVSGGRKVAAVNLWAQGTRVAHAVLGDIGTGLSPFPYVVTYPQDEHERLLVDRLALAGVEVERQTELVAFEEASDRMVARLKRADGSSERCTAGYIAGCDGAHSAVRHALGIGFQGGTYDRLFYVADVEARGGAIDGELHAALDTSDFLAVFPLKQDGRVRLIGTVRPDVERRNDDLSWRDVSRRVIDWLRVDVERVNWFSTYRVHHRVADRFASGRAFLLGDAAHIHSPVGGQGMNTGIGDAVNLAWKLASVLHGRASASILSTYEPERIAFARRLVATTDRAFTAVTSDGALARCVRLNLAPAVIPIFFRFTASRRFMYRTVSQTALRYPTSRLSEGRAGTVRGGDRLPWLEADASDNFAPLTSLDWQVHVYGDCAPAVQAVCQRRHLPLHVFRWRDEFSRAGIRRNAGYLVRPDGYVAVAEPEGGGQSIAAFLARWDITSAAVQPDRGARRVNS